jgi:hypothetical protein
MLVDGAILTAIVAVILVLTLAINPRIALSDYPEDVKAAVPPRTRKELRQGIVLALLALLPLLAIPLYSTWRIKQSQDELPYWMAFTVIVGEYLMIYMFDLLVLDWWMFHTWTPKFLVIPGTEGLPGYKNFKPHLKGHLTTGIVILALFSALVALIPTLLF